MRLGCAAAKDGTRQHDSDSVKNRTHESTASCREAHTRDLSHGGKPTTEIHQTITSAPAVKRPASVFNVMHEAAAGEVEGRQRRRTKRLHIHAPFYMAHMQSSIQRIYSARLPHQDFTSHDVIVSIAKFKTRRPRLHDQTFASRCRP